MNNRNIVLVIILVLLVVGGVVWYGLSRNTAIQDQDKPVLSVSAFNQTKTTEATQVTASPQDIIEFTLKAVNSSDKIIEAYSIQAEIGEISKGATLTDAGGASYNSASNSLVWAATDIPVGEAIERKFTVRVGDSKLDSLSIRFENEVLISLGRETIAGTTTPPPVYNAPPTGPSEMLTLSLALSATLSAFIIRRRQKTA